ncbi:Down syndrome cell adhesion molecule-like protein Dscam2 [Schistocerca gregaria]|uniref:Down syndrome cell adhesion molecule-like protein Dscam2 n=1 Tax=Schistocerca gregaria TaxID=7010 RepID=UPI00211F418A|nr:Down syndrome cell adhesion molecule-like protein Dscam2 [Schistocerca gregaria]
MTTATAFVTKERRSGAAMRTAVAVLLLAAACAGARLAAVLQGPVFLQEPPHRADFSNSTGVVLPCSAHGNPAPALRWQTGDGAPALEVAGLRSVLPNGSLLLAPFSPRQFRPDVHTAAYHCVASNSVGTAVSRRVAVRAAVAKQQYEAQVYDEYVVAGNTAVFRCHVPAFVRDHVTVTGWLRARSQRITPDVSAGK